MSNGPTKIGMPGAAAPFNSSVSRTDAAVASDSARAQAKPAVRSEQATAPEPQKIEAVAQRLDTYLRSVSRSLEFRVDQASGRTVISVRDSQTGDLIRQIPGEDVLRLAEMAEDQTIVLVNEKA